MVISRFVFVHRFFITISIFLANNGILCHRLGFSSMSGIWWVGCLHVNMDKFDDLCNAISLTFERADKVSYILVCIWLMSLILIFIFHACFLRWIYDELKCEKSTSLVIVGYSIKKIWILFVWGLMRCQIICSLHGIRESQFQPFCIHGCQCPERILGYSVKILVFSRPTGYML